MGKFCFCQKFGRGLNLSTPSENWALLLPDLAAANLKGEKMRKIGKSSVTGHF
jgi:hypothetical protein